MVDAIYNLMRVWSHGFGAGTGWRSQSFALAGIREKLNTVNVPDGLRVLGITFINRGSDVPAFMSFSAAWQTVKDYHRWNMEIYLGVGKCLTAIVLTLVAVYPESPVAKLVSSGDISLKSMANAPLNVPAGGKVCSHPVG